MMSLLHSLPSEIIDNLNMRLILFEIMTFCDFSTLWKKRQNMFLIPQPTESLIQLIQTLYVGDRSSRLTFSTNMISIHLLHGLWFIYIHVNMIYMMSLAHLLCSEIIDILHKPLIPFEIMTFCDFSTLWKKRQNVSLIPHPTKSLI